MFALVRQLGVGGNIYLHFYYVHNKGEFYTLLLPAHKVIQFKLNSLFFLIIILIFEESEKGRKTSLLSFFFFMLFSPPQFTHKSGNAFA